MRKLQHRSGFTLIEILCVVVILGIASAIIIPQIGSRDDLNSAAAARVLMSDLMYAQNRAIAMQKKHFVVFNGQTYTIESRNTDVSALFTVTQPITKDPYIVTFGQANTPLANSSLSSPTFGSSTTVAFDEMGSPYAYNSASNTLTPLSAAGTINVTCGAKTLRISIEPYTGEATVQ
jgi:prepilin-type N-terminal cleavage/methylation domain-containing protein